MPDSAPPGIGHYQPSDAASDYNYLTFVIQQLMGRLRTALEVQVVSCTNSGGMVPFGTVSVQPVVRTQDGGGYTQPHGTIHNLTYFRVQGGNNAIICDPVPGDLGVAFVLDRDTSSAVANANGLQSGTPGPNNTVPPGSWRRFSLSDGFYVGGNLNGTPENYVQFDGKGNINIVANGDVTITANGNTITLDGNVIVSGNLSAGSGATCSFTTPTGQIVTVQNGIITNMY